MCHETRVAYIPRVYGSGCRRPVTLAASHCDVATSRPPGDGTNDTGGHHAAHQQGRGARPGSHGARPGRLAGPPDGAAHETTATVHFHQNDTGWTVGRDGATAVLPDVKGLHYLRHLLQRPGLDVEAVDLAASVAGHPGAAVRDSAADVIDAQALGAYRARLADIDAELSEARSWADGPRSTRLRLEREALLDEIGAATGLGGRRRRFSSAQERARIAVRKAIVSAI